MSSSAPPQTNQYTYPKPSTLATRSLVSDLTKPINPTPQPPPSNDATGTEKPPLQRKTTDNYERAAAAATTSGALPATTAGSVAASVTDRPGVRREQSWKMSDFKGQQQGQMLAGKLGGQGYSSTQK